MAIEVLEDRRLLSVDGFATPTHTLLSYAGGPFATGNTGPFSPDEIKHAYGIDQITFEGGTVVGDGSGQTIAIVDAFNDPNIQADLAVFDGRFFPGQPAPMLTVVSQTGGSPNGVPQDPTGGWEVEEALDVEWAHAIAPKASLLLVVANSTSYSDLLTAERWAAGVAGVTVVTNSWGGGEASNEKTAYDPSFTTTAQPFQRRLPGLDRRHWHACRLSLVFSQRGCRGWYQADAGWLEQHPD